MSRRGRYVSALPPPGEFPLEPPALDGDQGLRASWLAGPAGLVDAVGHGDVLCGGHSPALPKPAVHRVARLRGSATATRPTQCAFGRGKQTGSRVRRIPGLLRD